MKEEPQKVDQQNPNTKLTKEELQEFEHQKSDLDVIKEETKKPRFRGGCKGIAKKCCNKSVL